MIQHSGEHLGANPTIDDIITEIRSRFSNVIPSVANIPEKVKEYVGCVLNRTGFLSDNEIICTFIESIMSPKNAMIPTKEIIELIQSNSLTDEQIGRLLEHLKKVREEAFFRVVGRLLNPEKREKYGIIYRPPPPCRLPRKKTVRVPKPPIIPNKRVTPRLVEKSMEQVRLMLLPLANLGNQQSKKKWNNHMGNIGLGLYPRYMERLRITTPDLVGITEIMGMLLEKYPEWDEENIPKRIRSFIHFLIQNNYFVETEENPGLKEALAGAFQKIRENKKIIFIYKIFGNDISKMIQTIRKKDDRKVVYYGYTETPISHVILEVLFIAGIFPRKKRTQYLNAIQGRIMELSKINPNDTEELDALQEIYNRHKSRH